MKKKQTNSKQVGCDETFPGVPLGLDRQYHITLLRGHIFDMPKGNHWINHQINETFLKNTKKIMNRLCAS